MINRVNKILRILFIMLLIVLTAQLIKAQERPKPFQVSIGVFNLGTSSILVNGTCTIISHVKTNEHGDIFLHIEQFPNVPRDFACNIYAVSNSIISNTVEIAVYPYLTKNIELQYSKERIKFFKLSKDQTSAINNLSINKLNNPDLVAGSMPMAAVFIKDKFNRILLCYAVGDWHYLKVGKDVFKLSDDVSKLLRLNLQDGETLK
jgi:hypothetical protein